MGISAHQQDKVKEACCQPTTDPEVLVRHAEQSQRKLMSFARGLAEELGLDPDMQVIKGPIKEWDRIESKAHGKYAGRYEDVKDYDRDRILFTDPEQILELRSMLRPGKVSNPFLIFWKKRGVEIVECDDAFLNRKKSGMVGVNLSVKIPLGKGRYHICEIQMMHEDMQDIDKETHERYEKKIRPTLDIAHAEGERELTIQEEQQIGAYQEMNWSQYDAGIVKCDLKSLLSPEWQENLEERLAGNTVRTLPKPAQQGAHLRLVAA